MGSKARVAKYIVPIIQKCINDNGIESYIEPFVGGANIIDKISCEQKIGNDIRTSLVALLSYVQNGGQLPNYISYCEYSNVRSNPEAYDDWYVGCVGFLASYNGRYFDGGYAKSGYEKTKSGERYRDYYRESKENLLKQSQQSSFKDIAFQCSNYVDLFNEYRPNNSVIYCDPPYAQTKQYSNSKNFDYDKFWNIVREYSKTNYILVSELQCPEDFVSMWQQEVSRSIKSTDKSNATEKLFVYKDGLYANRYLKYNKS